MKHQKVFFWSCIVCLCLLYSCKEQTPTGPENPIATNGISAADGIIFDGKILTVPEGNTCFLTKLPSSLNKSSSGIKTYDFDKLYIRGNLIIEEIVKINATTIELKGEIKSSKSLYIKADTLYGNGIINTSASAAQDIKLVKSGSLQKTYDSGSHGGPGGDGGSGTNGDSGEFPGFNNNRNGTNGGRGNDATSNGTNGSDALLTITYIMSSIQIDTYGGRGGNGGNGGNGGSGGNSDYYRYERQVISNNVYIDRWEYGFYLTNNYQTVIPVPAFNGGSAGSGGNGSNGGNAGSITVYYHYLAPGANINCNSNGGNPGLGGNPGTPGAKGIGQPMNIVVDIVAWGNHNQNSIPGSAVPDGQNGIAGQIGNGGAPGLSRSPIIQPY
ncbi:MAG: hypothetical protein NTX44_07425 [Ignavibacteriales bacterium]|nr:hypothetical protein [Ignavibacteriales bacterium]